MCTMITRSLTVDGRLKAQGLWEDVTRVSVAFDHPVELDDEHALLLDLVDTRAPDARRVALELPLADARRLYDELAVVLEAAQTV